MPPGTETAGMPFSLADFPHVDGVLEAFDDPEVRTIVLQWGTRLGKTTACLSLMARVAATMPRNMMLVSPDKSSAGRVVSTRLYPILESCDSIRNDMPPEVRRSKFEVKLGSCRVYVGWAGSASSLADVGAWFGVGNEIDKWQKKKSSEADPLSLFLNRFKGFPDHKIILESTPDIKGKSRIEHWMNRSRQHLRWVPCPHCGEYQQLVAGDEASRYGIRWDRDSKGNSDPDIAFATAYYLCCCCNRKIENHHRRDILRNGVWCPVGCTVDTNGKVQGKSDSDVRDIYGFGPLASWYSLLETWGGFPRKMLMARGNQGEMQDVHNAYLAIPWERKRSRTTWETLGERLGGENPFPAGTVPDEVAFLTCGIDVQDNHFVWIVCGWGENDIGYVIDYGRLGVWEDVRAILIDHKFSGTELAPLGVRKAGVDSGHRTDEIYGYTAEPRLKAMLVPTKGADSLEKPIVPSSLDFSRREHAKAFFAAKGLTLWKISKAHWHEEIQTRLDKTSANQPGSLTLCDKAAGDPGFLMELLNNGPETTEKGRTIWGKLRPGDPDDYRDALVIARVMKELVTSGDEMKVKRLLALRTAPAGEVKRVQRPVMTTPDGRAFVASQR